MTLSQKLVILRKNKGITQDEFAKALDVSRQSVHKWESGQCYPEVPKIIKMKEIFEISIDDLLDDNFEIPLPEKKKRRATVKKETTEKAKDVIKTEAKKEEKPEPVLKNTAAEASLTEEPVIEEIKVEVIENSEKGKETPISENKEEKVDDLISAKKETPKEAEEKKKGFFSKIFGRK